MDTTFRLPIFKQLVFRDILINKQSTLIFFGVLTGVILLNGWLTHYDSQDPSQDILFHPRWYGILFMIIGLFQTASVYGEFKRSATLQEYLLLPASTFEKWISRWFRSLPLYIITFTVAYWIASLVLNIVLYATTKAMLPFFNPFQAPIFELWKWYVLMHSVFLVGAVHFNKNAIFKTLFVLFLLMVIYSIVGGGLQFLLLNPFEDEVYIHNNSFGWLGEFINQNSELVITLIKGFVWFLLVPFFWVVSYLKLSEKEV